MYRRLGSSPNHRPREVFDTSGAAFNNFMDGSESLVRTIDEFKMKWYCDPIALLIHSQYNSRDWHQSLLGEDRKSSQRHKD